MSYQVLARKWRPRRFADLVGQGHVVRALTNALDHDRLHHAFLFTGTRGVGKTTIARILAKSLNCETGVSSQPCGRCSTCLEVDDGRFVDLIEVDAASRTKVDDTRELLDNVQYAPTRGRYKVYLIDEVHMLSGHSFNALLKTLEEPPPHVKFLLATTDPQKLPVTVLSRCLQFNLKRLQPMQIEAQLAKILGAEGITFDAASLSLLARSADGSMRDSLSLLDQAIAFGGGRVNEADVREMLGSIDHSVITDLLAALAALDAAVLLRVVNSAAERSIDFDILLQDLLLALHRISLAQAAPEVLDALGDEQAQLIPLARALTPEDVQLFYQIGLMGRRDLPYAPDPRSGLEMILLRMLAFRPVPAPTLEGETRTTAAGARSAPSVSAAPAATAPAPLPAPPAPVSAPGVTAARDAAAAVQPASAAKSAPPSDWAGMVACLKLTGLVRELATNASLDAYADGVMHLTLDATFAHLLNKEREAALKQALQTLHGQALSLQIRIGHPAAETPAREKIRSQDERLQAATSAIAEDPNVRSLQETFNARVNPGSIRPKL
jgi:DNA polymerase-3 subunit gamma/tau